MTGISRPPSTFGANWFLNPGRFSSRLRHELVNHKRPIVKRRSLPALVASAAPDRLTLSGRDYRRGDLDTRAYTGWVKRGTTSGGGTIFTLAGTNGTPTVLWVRKGDKVWSYGLIGGP